MDKNDLYMMAKKHRLSIKSLNQIKVVYSTIEVFLEIVFIDFNLELNTENNELML